VGNRELIRSGADVFDYIECFYNPKRRHSTLGYPRAISALIPTRLLSTGAAAWRSRFALLSQSTQRVGHLNEEIEP
jgi:transposase InsO family protein